MRADKARDPFDRAALRALCETGAGPMVSVPRSELRRLLTQIDEHEAERDAERAARAEIAGALASAVPDNSLTAEARRWLLKGAGEYAADGKAADLGYVRVDVRPFGKRGADVRFYRGDGPRSAHHVEFGRTGGEMLLSPGGGLSAIDLPGPDDEDPK